MLRKRFHYAVWMAFLGLIVGAVMWSTLALGQAPRRGPCFEDVQQLCPDAKTARERAQCLKSHKAELSPVCKERLERAQGTRWEHYMAEGTKAYQDGQETNAEMFYLAALEDVQNAGPEDPRLAATLNTLAVLYHTQKKYAQAESLYQRVLKLLEQTVGP